ncbi:MULTISPECIES: peptidoglycan-binding domain-containing protein [Streptomyces]|uniref:Peptidoglycan binding-like domain-containing protein n=1 Tax=Streptomyces luteosporeus TaxID=173856 RepID=A0ABP6FYP6_9ACTN
MRVRDAAIVLAAAGALLAPVAGTASAAQATPQSAPAVHCRLENFIGYYCGHYSGADYTDFGDRGERVKEIQSLLVFSGYSVGSTGIDGEFGRATERAVKRFQADNGLKDDGKVGPKTWHALRTP